MRLSCHNNNNTHVIGSAMLHYPMATPLKACLTVALLMSGIQVEAAMSESAKEEGRGVMVVSPAETVKAGKRQESIARLLERANARHKFQAWKQAVADYTTILESDPENTEALKGRGRCYIALGEPDQALADFRRLPKPVYFDLGAASFRLLQYAEAAEYFQETIRRFSKDSVAFRNLGYTFFAQADYDNALPALRRAIEIDPGNSTYAHLIIYLADVRRGHTDDGTLRAALATWQDPWACALGELLLGGNGQEKLLKLASINPDTRKNEERVCEAGFYLGSRALLDGDKETARTWFQRAVDTRCSRTVEHTLARAELARLTP